jgi:hypothetical protein
MRGHCPVSVSPFSAMQFSVLQFTLPCPIKLLVQHLSESLSLLINKPKQQRMRLLLCNESLSCSHCAQPSAFTEFPAQGKGQSANIAHSRALRGSKAWMRRKLHG